MFHADEEAGAQTAHSAGSDRPEGGGAAWRTEPEPATGEPQVHTDKTRENKTLCTHIRNQ